MDAPGVAERVDEIGCETGQSGPAQSDGFFAALDFDDGVLRLARICRHLDRELGLGNSFVKYMF